MASVMLERDAVKVDTKHYKVELETERVRVVRISYAAREKSVMHQHPPAVVIFFDRRQIRIHLPRGQG